MVVLWVVVGLVAGFVASLIGRQSRNSMAINLLVGVAGALAGGAVLTANDFVASHRFGIAFTVGSILTAIAGAAILLLVTNLVRRGAGH